MKFKKGDRIICIESISERNGGPRKGEIFIVTSINFSYIGFPLDRLTDSTYHQDTINGYRPNWGASNFELCPDLSIFQELGD